jgi:hypothetical protein
VDFLYFVHCVDYSEGHFGGIGLIRQCTVFLQCMDLPRKGILYSLLTYLGGHLAQCMGVSRKGILYSLLTYLGGYFVQSMDLSRKGILYSVLSYMGQFCTV